MNVLFVLASMLSASAPDAAKDLAERVHRAAGGDRLSEVAELRFTFVVVSEGKRVAAIEHRWDRKNGRDRVIWTDKAGVARDVVVDLSKKAAPGSDEEKAYARWVNDSYWLMLPLKLLDGGVKRTVEEKRTHKGKLYEVLRLEFEGVGLTPGDKYWLFIDPATSRIERWEMVLQGEAPPAKGFSFEDYRAVGPLTLALDHASDDGLRRITFEGVEAFGTVKPEDFAKTP